MRQLSADVLEARIRTAIDADDADEIAQMGALLDNWEANEKAKKATPSLLAVALYYAEQGLQVFPLEPMLKTPYRRSRGCLDATSDPDVIRRWWGAQADSNIGIATGTLVDVVDIDGTAGQVSRARNADLFASLAVIGTVSTPRPGGVHLYVPAAGKGNKAGMLPGVDYRGTGGYVVTPPSRTDVGTYQWTVPLQLAAAVAA